ncbi:MAG: hypothetical protein PHY43_08185 [Verrucomicrobiales bacterium]|nr:hypothetical protein [Verrucomicrobiales bacterium]
MSAARMDYGPLFLDAGGLFSEFSFAATIISSGVKVVSSMERFG